MLFKNLKIRYKLIFLYTLVFFVTYTLSSVFLYNYFKDTITKNIESTLTASTESMTDMVLAAADTSIRNHLRTITSTYLNVIEQHYNSVLNGELSEIEAKNEIAKIINSQKVGSSGYVYVLNSKGVLQLHPSSELVGNDISNYDFVQYQIKNKNGYLEYDWKNPSDINTRPKALYMIYFEPWDWIISTSSYRDEFADLINIEDFRDRFINKKFGDTGYSYVLGPDGTFLIHPKLEGQNMLLSENKAEKEIITNIYTLKTGTVIYDWKNPGEEKSREKLTVFKYIPEYKWIVASSSYSSDFFQPLYAMKYLLVIIYLICIAFIVTINERASKYITTPILSLKETLSTASNGNLDIRSDLNFKDEISDLARFFNQFIESIQKQRSNLIEEIDMRKQTELKLLESNNRFQMILNTMKESFVEVDSFGNIIYCNPEFSLLLEYSQFDLMNMNLMNFLDTTNKQILKSHLELRRLDISDSYEINFISKSGNVFNCIINATPLKNESGIVIGSFGVITDITDLKKLNENLEIRIIERTKDLENSLLLLQQSQEKALKTEILTSLNELVTSLAHNINTPLGICLTTTSHLTAKYNDITQSLNNNSLNKSQLLSFLSTSTESIGLLEKNLNRTNELVKSFKMLSGVNSIGQKTNFNIVEYLNHEISNQLKLHMNRIKISLNYNADEILIHSYPNVFSIILDNLITNTIDHNTIVADMPSIIISIEQSNNKIELIYKEYNNIELDQLKIFDPFFTSKPSQHAGLGLTILYSLVSQTLNGEIHYTFEEGYSIFNITFTY